MKTHQQKRPWELRCVTHDDGRRLITLWRTPAWCQDPRLDARELPRYQEISVSFPEEDLTAFEVRVQPRIDRQAAEPAEGQSEEGGAQLLLHPCQQFGPQPLDGQADDIGV